MIGPTAQALAAQHPPADHPIPRLVRDLASGRLVPRWLNGTGGLTVAEARPDGDGFVRYLKWSPRRSKESLWDEAERLRWLEHHSDHPVPKVLDYVDEGGAEVLVTSALQGESAVAEHWKKHPESAIKAIAVGLRRLHSLPTDDCPFQWTAQERIAEISAVNAHPGTKPTQLAQLASAIPDVDRTVICHGDPCAPNTLIHPSGQFLAHVDLGRLGLADRWADLAVASMALEWNYGSNAEHCALFWDTYGVEPDEERIKFYRDLWNAE